LCEFGLEEVHFSGNVVSKDDIHADPGKVDAVKIGEGPRRRPRIDQIRVGGLLQSIYRKFFKHSKPWEIDCAMLQ
jgi:hypothetical protein